jgi:hypothetical protein
MGSSKEMSRKGEVRNKYMRWGFKDDPEQKSL